MEADLNTALGVLAAMKAASAPCMYTEMLTFDPRENLLLMGHAGVHDPRLAAKEGVTIVPDAEYQHSDRLEGAWLEFIMDSGPVTCLSLYDTGKGYRMVAFRGASLGGPRRVEGFAHALVRPELPVTTLLPRLMRYGMTQHFAVVPGDVAGVLAKWCQLSSIEFRHEVAT
jgi:L-arabinose isomerase